MNKTEAEFLLQLIAAEIDMQTAQMTNFRWEIISILVFAFLWYALLFTYIEHQSDKRLERIEKQLEAYFEKTPLREIPVGYVKLQAVDEFDIKV